MSMMMQSAAKKKKKTVQKSSSQSSYSSGFDLGGGGGPPPSNAVTSIWYWDLDGVMTTVMYTRDVDEIWCNGFTVYAETKTDSYLGKASEFSIDLDETGTSHKAHLLHMDDGSYVLYVDGIPIAEHTG